MRVDELRFMFTIAIVTLLLLPTNALIPLEAIAKPRSQEKRADVGNTNSHHLRGMAQANVFGRKRGSSKKSPKSAKSAKSQKNRVICHHDATATDKNLAWKNMWVKPYQVASHVVHGDLIGNCQSQQCSDLCFHQPCMDDYVDKGFGSAFWPAPCDCIENPTPIVCPDVNMLCDPSLDRCVCKDGYTWFPNQGACLSEYGGWVERMCHNYDDVIDPATADHDAFDWLENIDNVSALNIENNPTRIVQRYILALLYYATDGTNWDANAQDKWLSSDSECDWAGVTCDANNLVIELDKGLGQLGGYIPNCINGLSLLTLLNLGANNIGGELPADLRRLGNLEYLNLATNNLSGTIPDDIGEMRNLYSLHLSRNSLTGELPTNIVNLSSMTALYLYNNELEGPIEFLENLSSIQYLGLEYNDFTGSIPDLSKLINLEEMYIQGNPDLEGRVRGPDCGDADYHVDLDFPCYILECNCNFHS